MMYPSLSHGQFGFFGIVWLLLILALIALKGYTLWFAAKRNEKWWFIALLILNTLGILEIVYIVFFLKKWHKGLNVPPPAAK